MTKRDLVIRISNETGLVQQQVLDVVQKTLDYIAEAVSKGDKVELRNFGVFEVKVRKARIGRNPNAPATDVPPHRQRGPWCFIHVASLVFAAGTSWTWGGTRSAFGADRPVDVGRSDRRRT